MHLLKGEVHASALKRASARRAYSSDRTPRQRGGSSLRTLACERVSADNVSSALTETLTAAASGQTAAVDEILEALQPAPLRPDVLPGDEPREGDEHRRVEVHLRTRQGPSIGEPAEAAESHV